MATMRETIVNLALAEVGTEGGRASGDDKYIEYYNKITGASFDEDTTPWCAIFVTYIYRIAGVPTTLAPNFASCTTMRDTFLKKKGYWKTHTGYTPKAGDMIFFDWDASGNCDHVGIVEKVTGSKVYTIEGNSQGGYKTYGVRHKSYTRTTSYIAGYGAIPLDGLTSTVTVPDTGSGATGSGSSNTTTTSANAAYIKKFQTWLNTNYRLGLAVDGSYGPASKKGAIKALQTCLVKTYSKDIDIDGSFGPDTKKAVQTIEYGDHGTLVTIAQGMLYGRGYDPKGFNDNNFGPGMKAATIKFQKDKKLTQDGCIGTLTWQRLANG